MLDLMYIRILPLISNSQQLLDLRGGPMTGMYVSHSIANPLVKALKFLTHVRVEHHWWLLLESYRARLGSLECENYS